MRLIDADELIKGRVENDLVRIAAGCAPTAYDIDKVVEQLEKDSQLALEINEQGVYAGLQIAIETVKKGGADEMSNYMPACRQCNHYKRGNSLEGFRSMIERIPEKLERDSYIYRVGVNYKNVIPNKRPIAFYFELRGEQE